MNDISPNATAVAERQAKPIDVVRGALERMRPQLEMALPKHLTADRLLRVAMTAVQTTPKLLDCERTSLYRAVMMCAQLGLEPDGVLGQAYLIPFGSKVQFIPGYKGLLSLARNSGDVSSIAAHEVRENDTFEFDFASGEPPKHTFNIRKASERGDVIAFYAVAKFHDGAFHWDMMTRAEVDRIRDGSQGYQTAKRYNKNDSPWIEHYVEMGKKTVIRRIAKYLPMSVQRAAAIADAYDTGKHVTMDKYGEVVIEGDSAVIEDDAPRLENRQSNLDRFEEQHAAPEPGADAAASPEPPAVQEAPASARRQQAKPADPIERDADWWAGNSLAVEATGKEFLIQIRQRCREARNAVEIECLRDHNGEAIDALAKADRQEVLGWLADRETELKKAAG